MTVSAFGAGIFTEEFSDPFGPRDWFLNFSL
jgi:hypothetical protein